MNSKRIVEELHCSKCDKWYPVKYTEPQRITWGCQHCKGPCWVPKLIRHHLLKWRPEESTTKVESETEVQFEEIIANTSPSRAQKPRIPRVVPKPEISDQYTKSGQNIFPKYVEEEWNVLNRREKGIEEEIEKSRIRNFHLKVEYDMIKKEAEEMRIRRSRIKDEFDMIKKEAEEMHIRRSHIRDKCEMIKKEDEEMRIRRSHLRDEYNMIKKRKPELLDTVLDPLRKITGFDFSIAKKTE